MFVPPPPGAVEDAISALDRWLHSDDPLPPLIKADATARHYVAEYDQTHCSKSDQGSAERERTP